MKRLLSLFEFTRHSQAAKSKQTKQTSKTEIQKEDLILKRNLTCEQRWKTATP